MATVTHYYALPFRKSEAARDHIVECLTEDEARQRAEQMASYPEYVGAIAFKFRRRDGERYGGSTLLATFGVFEFELKQLSGSDLHR